MKTCIHCKVDKPLVAFHRNHKSKDGRRGSCAECSRKYAREYVGKNRDVVVAKMRGYYAAHRETLLIKQRQYRARNVGALNARQRERVTGFSPELVDKTLAHQEGKCAICLDPLRLKSLHRDHCHTTGKPRGLLCMRCNTALGKFKDNVRTLARAIAYLKHPPVERLKGKT